MKWFWWLIGIVMVITTIVSATASLGSWTIPSSSGGGSTTNNYYYSYYTNLTNYSILLDWFNITGRANRLSNFSYDIDFNNTYDGRYALVSEHAKLGNYLNSTEINTISSKTNITIQNRVWNLSNQFFSQMENINTSLTNNKHNWSLDFPIDQVRGTKANYTNFYQGANRNRMPDYSGSYSTNNLSCSVGSVLTSTCVASAADLVCSDCLGTDEINDIYLMNNGDTGSGNYVFLGTVAVGATTATHSLTVTNSATDDVLRILGYGSYGTLGKINFGDADYTYIEEDVDDSLQIRTSGRITLNGSTKQVGGMCIGNPSCTAYGTNGLLVVEGGISIDNDGTPATATSGLLTLGDGSDSTSGIQIKDGYMCIGNDGISCPGSTTSGDLTANGTISGGRLQFGKTPYTAYSERLCWTGTTQTSFIYDCDGSPGDIAEWYLVPGKQELELGNVVRINSNLFGIISTSPYEKIGEEILPKELKNTDRSRLNNVLNYKGNNYAAIAIAGRVPVKTIGIVKPGDRLTPAGSYAKTLQDHESSHVIGIALNPLMNDRWNVLSQNYYYTSPDEINDLKEYICEVNQMAKICS